MSSAEDEDSSSSDSDSAPQVKILIHKGNINEQPPNLPQPPQSHSSKFSPNPPKPAKSPKLLQNPPSNQTPEEATNTNTSSTDIIRLITDYKSTELSSLHTKLTELEYKHTF